MPDFEFDWVDAFTTAPFGGNACAVIHNAGSLPDSRRMDLVRETSLSECAYIVNSDVADFGARYYLAEREILMAGHPTIATVASLLRRGLVPHKEGRADFTLEVGAGVLPITVTGADTAHPSITMTQAAPQFLGQCDPSEIAAIYGLDPSDIIAQPQVVSTGTPFCIALLKDKDALRRAVLDVEALLAWRARMGNELSGLMEPFLVTLGGVDGGDTFSRLLLPPPMPPEDPFTGSATGCMAAYLWHHGLIDAPSFIAEQGQWLNRPGRALVEVLGPRDAISGIRVGGQGVILMSGTLHL